MTSIATCLEPYLNSLPEIFFSQLFEIKKCFINFEIQSTFININEETLSGSKHLMERSFRFTSLSRFWGVDPQTRKPFQQEAGHP